MDCLIWSTSLQYLFHNWSFVCYWEAVHFIPDRRQCLRPLDLKSLPEIIMQAPFSLPSSLEQLASREDLV